MKTWALRGSVLALCVAAGCTSWRPLQSYDGWTLYTRGDQHVDPASFERAFEPAIRSVEDALGPFKRRVSVYAWDAGAEPEKTGAEQIHEGDEGVIEVVPGIGPARVRAFHARGDGIFGAPSGVFVGTAEPGTAVHELVHARLAEDHPNLSLWFEEGLACVLGDGFLAKDRWVVDGLACWPLRELYEQQLDDDELAHLLALHADSTASVRDNVLVHFVGWAIVFDMYREAGSLDWKRWCDRYGQGMELGEARERVSRTLAPQTLEMWLGRLSDPRPEVRLATAKGVWKLRSPIVVSKLVDALEKENDPLVKVGFSINALAAAGEMRLSGSLRDRMWRSAWPALKRTRLEDPSEQEAVEKLLRSFRWGSNQKPNEPLQALKRFWAE